MLTDLLNGIFGLIGGVLTVAIQEPHVSLTQTRNVSESTLCGRPTIHKIRYISAYNIQYLPIACVENTITVVKRRAVSHISEVGNL